MSQENCYYLSQLASLELGDLLPILDNTLLLSMLRAPQWLSYFYSLQASQLPIVRILHSSRSKLTISLNLSPKQREELVHKMQEELKQKDQ